MTIETKRNETATRKRYIIRCVACGHLGDVQRSDAIYCCSGCRVWGKRHPDVVEAKRALAADARVPLPFLLQVEAYLRLFPDRHEAIENGSLALDHPTRKDVIADEAREEAVRAFQEIVALVVREIALRP